MEAIEGNSEKQCCGSGMFIPVPDPDFLPIPDPGSWIPDPGSRFPDPGSQIQKPQQKRGVKKMCCYTFLCSHKFHKNENYYIFEMLKKNILPSFQRIIELFTQIFVTRL
jgi:hypothetical protein